MLIHQDGMWLENGVAYSVDDLEVAKRLYYGVMVPPKPVKSVLMLGVCKNTTGRLIWEQYPDCQLTLVDHHPLDKETINQDALEFVKATEQTFDYALVDLCEDGEIPDLVYSKELYAALARVTPQVISNVIDVILKDFTDYYKPVAVAKSFRNLIYFLEAV